MLTGLAFFTMALLLLGAIGYHLLSDRAREIAHLDRRIALLTMPIAAAPRRLGPLPVPEMIAPLLARAQVEPTSRMIVMMAGGLGVAFLLALLIGGPILGLTMAMLPGGAILLALKRRARKRIDGLIDALPFYIDAVRQLLTVGNSIPQALVRALPDAPKPIQTFFAHVGRRIELGAPVAESLQQVADRLCVPEVSMLAAAVRINTRFGGSMTAVLSNLSQIMRERLRVKRELRAATGEIRVSTWVLVAMPLVGMLLLFTTNRDYVDFFLSDPRGHRWALIAAGLQGLGMLVMSRLMRLSF